MRRQAMSEGKVFAKNTAAKELLIYKKIPKLINRKIYYPVVKLAKELNTLQKDEEMSSKHLKRF